MKKKELLKASYCMPTYNKVEYLAHAVESFLEQKYENKELIIVDDASTDMTEQLTSYYVIKYDNIKLVQLTINVGVATARNIARENATGDIIFTMDADDMSELGRTETTMKFFEKHKDVSIVYGKCAVINGYGQQEGLIGAKPFAVWELRQENYIAHPTVAFRKDIPVTYRDGLRFIDDWYFYMDCVHNGVQFGVIDSILGVYRPLPEGLTLQSGQINEDKEKAKADLRREFKDFDDDITDRLKTANQQKVRIKRLLSEIPVGSRVLDIGCNGGYIATLMRDKRHCNVLCIDCAPNLVRIARGKGLRVEHRDARKFSYNKIFDVVVLGDIIEHLQPEDVKKVLENAHDSLLPGGKLVVTVPYKHSYYNASRIVEHVRDYDVDDFKKIFDRFEYKSKPIMIGNNAVSVWMLITGTKV